MSKIKVFIFEEYSLLKAGLKSLLVNIKGIEVINNGESKSKAINFVKRKKPAIVIINISTNKIEAFNFAAEINKMRNTNIIFLSTHKENKDLNFIYDKKAYGIISKNSSMKELEKAIKTVAKDKVYISPNFPSKTQKPRKAKVFNDESTIFEELPPRKKEILKLIAESYSTKEIATKLGLSTKTVEAHRLQLMNKLGIYDIAGLVKFALRIGLASEF
jgi:RNA polymerase sigma factor (sigma-70 family)